MAKDLHKCHLCSFSSYRTDKLKEHISRQHTEKPLQLELSEDLHSGLLKDTDMETMPEMPKSRRNRITTGKKGKRQIENRKVAVTKLRSILPKT